MSKIVIVGLGPRGLSAALYALYKGHEVVLVDPDPLSSWSPPNMIADIEMRSPASFDLVTFLPELEDYSLLKFLGHSNVYKQKEVEECPIKVNRIKFCEYMNFILSHVLKSSFLIKEKVIQISSNVVKTETRTILADKIVLSIGSCSFKPYPNWVDLSKVKSIKDIITNLPINQSVMVVGSGQGAAELVYLLSKENKVKWVINKEPRVSQYPLPSWENASYRSGLSSYYSTISSWEARMDYIKAIKDWQPSITPYIRDRLFHVQHKYKVINPTTLVDLNQEEVDIICIQTGILPSLSKVPISVKAYSFLPEYPSLSSGFRTSNPYLHITGMLAMPFDGPRQASLISAGITSKSIIEFHG